MTRSEFWMREFSAAAAADTDDKFTRDELLILSATWADMALAAFDKRFLYAPA